MSWIDDQLKVINSNVSKLEEANKDQVTVNANLLLETSMLQQQIKNLTKKKK